jgi:hypothetical protein
VSADEIHQRGVAAADQLAMEQNTRKENRLESIDATGLWRFLFWLCFVLGNMALLLAWGLAHVPRPDYGGDFRPDYLARLSVAVLM